MSALIQLNTVSLDYLIKTGTDSLKKTFAYALNPFFRFGANPRIKNPITNGSFRALNDIDLTIQPGTRLGLLGPNGAGKSSLLRVMGGIYQPTLGSVARQGRTSCIFDINLGLNMEATGYENIINLGTMRGFSKSESRAIINDVESFTGLGDFLNQPVRTYSSGMFVKLAFAVATAKAPDILLIDEIIGVGDQAFIQSAHHRLSQIIDQAQIMVLTSHSKDIIQKFCNQVAVMSQGQILFIGDTQAALDFYDQQDF